MSQLFNRTTKEEEDHLIQLIAKGENPSSPLTTKALGVQAKRKLITLLHPLVISVATYYIGEGDTNVDQGLINAGNRGLKRAIRCYIKKRHYKIKSFKFSAYAAWWVQAQIEKELSS